MLNQELPRILHVDDDADARFLFGRSVVRAGLRNQIDIADSGDEAMAYLQECLNGEQPWPCAVFLDVEMPHRNGFEVLTWMRAQGIAGKTVIVMHSSSEDPDHIKQAFKRGAHAFLPRGDVEATLRQTSPRLA